MLFFLYRFMTEVTTLTRYSGHIVAIIMEMNPLSHQSLEALLTI